MTEKSKVKRVVVLGGGILVYLRHGNWSAPGPTSRWSPKPNSVQVPRDVHCPGSTLPVNVRNLIMR